MSAVITFVLSAVLLTPCTVVHVPQHHQVAEEAYEDSAASQFAVLKYAAAHPTSEYVIEDLPQDFTYRGLPERTKSMISQHFRHGIPASYRDLTQDQRYYLVAYGGGMAALSLGLISRAYSNTANSAQFDYFARQEERFKRWFTNPITGSTTLMTDAVMFIPEVKAVAMDEREIATYQKVTSVCRAIRTPNPRVVLVFGEAHDFSSYFNSTLGFHFERLHDFAGVNFATLAELKTYAESRTRYLTSVYCEGEQSRCAQKAQLLLDDIDQYEHAGKGASDGAKMIESDLAMFTLLQFLSGHPRASFKFRSRPLSPAVMQALVAKYLR